MSPFPEPLQHPRPSSPDCHLCPPGILGCLARTLCPLPLNPLQPDFCPCESQRMTTTSRCPISTPFPASLWSLDMVAIADAVCPGLLCRHLICPSVSPYSLQCAPLPMQWHLSPASYSLGLSASLFPFKTTPELGFHISRWTRATPPIVSLPTSALVRTPPWLLVSVSPHRLTA